MAENIIFYGPPGTGKTFFMQKMMSDYIDYNIEDDTIRQTYVGSCVLYEGPYISGHS